MNKFYELVNSTIKENSLLNDVKINHNQYVELFVEQPKLLECLLTLKNSDIEATILSDCFAADFPDREKRFEIVYNLFSLKHNSRLIVKTQLTHTEKAPSICSLYSAANWYEREIFDLFGIDFESHPDMRRLLTDYGFIGHPLRKDFPLTGYLQVKYDEKLEKVIYEPVKLDQEYRNFDSISPWEKNPVIKGNINKT